ncbi:glycosidase [Microbacterium lushaniae]|uniref:Glycosidase n=1 Tax=Microbacterium lushaniae TaxID=2614639 RepID=A0A5J6L1F7_9MICO|nr:glycosidase [Microbacterium lushaniae]QEW02339.1 glycosidase [Microbacterium lushaniae]
MTAAVPYRLTRIGIVMTPDPDDPDEVEGVLNPGSGRGPDGELYLLPRLVAAGNVSRVGLARVVIEDGVPVGVVREGVVLAPDRGWERGADHGGVEDPRITWIDAVGVHVMTYVAFGPLGPRTALAVSDDLRTWRRLGPALFRYQDDLDTDLNLFHNKDTVFFPEPVRAPDGTEALAVLHRPMWDLGETRPGQGVRLPAGVEDPRQSIWISYVPLTAVRADLANLTLWEQHRFVAGPQFPFEALKIGGGPPPLRVPEGWLVLHHGVTGVIDNAFAQQRNVNYAAGALLLDAADPGRVLARTAEPLLAPETPDERSGIVPNVVFPTAVEQIDGRYFVFYGMADSKIGVALLERSDGGSPP